MYKIHLILQSSFQFTLAVRVFVELRDGLHHQQQWCAWANTLFGELLWKTYKKYLMIKEK
jgi:meiotically up-regulated gene 157 (Mug157) protein